MLIYPYNKDNTLFIKITSTKYSKFIMLLFNLNLNFKVLTGVFMLNDF